MVSTLAKWGSIGFSSLVAVTLMVSCQKNNLGEQASSVSSIDTIATGGESQSRGNCGPNQAGAPNLKSVWESLPPRMKLEFPIDSGRIRLDAGASQYCQNEVFPYSSIDIDRREMGNTDTCWSPAESAAQAAVLPVIHLESEPKAINEHLIAEAITAYLEFYIDDLFGPVIDQAHLNQQSLKLGEKQLSNFTADIRKSRKLLAQAFIDDMKASNQTAILEKLSQKFRASSGVLHESIPLQNFITAQLVDAYYCNQTTVKQFNDNALIRTRGAFLSIVDFLGAPWYAEIQ